MDFTKEESYKIQSVLNLFNKYFSFKINGKNLETLIIQGGMGIDISTLPLALACAKTGSAGTFATSISSALDELNKITPEQKKEFIIGINNLVALNNYEENYLLGKNLGLDYIISGAGISKEVLGRIKNQKNRVDSIYYGKNYITIPIVSSVAQLPGHINRNAGIVVCENVDAGGHNGFGFDFEKTIEEYKKSNIQKNGNKIVFAGGVRTPNDFVKVLDAGFDAVQLGTIFLLSEQVNIFDDYRQLVLHSKNGDVGNVVSPAGLAGKGFKSEGIMRNSLNGINSRKFDCVKKQYNNCLKDCTRIADSAKIAGIDCYGDYCIKKALQKLHTKDRTFYPEGELYFCGARPQDLFLREYMLKNKLVSLPAKKIVGMMLEGVFDSVLDGVGLKDEHKNFLELQYKAYRYIEPEKLSGKIFNY